MATVHFTGTYYSGSDGMGSVTLRVPGHYQVSDAKAAQLLADYPQEFSLVLEGEETQPEKAPSADEKSEKVAEVSRDTKVDDKAVEKPTKKK